MTTSTLTSKGQITIPSVVRAALGIEAGSRVEFIETAKGQFSIVPATNSVKELQGMLRKPAKAVSIEDMNLAIANQASKAASASKSNTEK
jgi:antitoxin PrlF